MSKDVGPLVESYVGHFTVGIVKKSKNAASQFGSGTLIRFGEIEGVLTCAHVLEELSKLDEIGIVCFPARKRIQTFSIKRSYTDMYSCGEKIQTDEGMRWPQHGPDIGFLKLPSNFVADLEAVASVANLETQLKLFRLDEPAYESAFNVVAGVVEEWSDDLEDSPLRLIKEFTCLLGVGRTTHEGNFSGFDVVKFTPVPEEGFPLPKSYRGVSGGGLWRLYLDANNELIQRRLLGTAYWETEGGYQDILCNGYKGFYDSFVTGIAKKWAKR